jgi:dTMP kinase
LALQHNRRFIVFEGIDGSGKSTQIKRLGNRLSAMGYSVYNTFEPTRGPIGSLLRHILSGETEVGPHAVAHLFAADRTEHILHKTYGIKSKVDQGTIVLCDRYYFSSFAYHAREVDMERIIDLNSYNMQLLKPTVTVFIDVDPAVGFKRLEACRPKLELFETEIIMKQVRNSYFRAFDRLRDQETVLAVDGNRDETAVEKAVWDGIQYLFQEGK